MIRARVPLFAMWCPLLLLALVLAAGCGGEEKEKPAADAAPQAQKAMVTTAPVEEREVVYTLEQVGSLVASDRAMLRNQLAATVAEIDFREGARVEKGAVLVRLDDAKTRAEIRNLEARIEQLQVRLGFKSKTLERNRKLLNKSAIPQHAFDQLATEVKETELAISQVKAELARQREYLTYTVIRAPFSGVVGAKDISVGDYLKAGDPVVEVVVLDPLEISFQVPERYKSKLSLGQSVNIRVASAGEERFQGEIFFISPTVDTTTRTFLVKARAANPEGRLNPGMFARVTLVTDVHPKARVVPWASVIQTEREAYIYVIKDDVAHKTVIKLGKVTTDLAEVLEPELAPGTLVAVEGKYACKDGGEVKTSAAPAKSPSTQQ